MADIVRYRNKHTGNKKPQLVTTDFDIMEDVLDRGWTVPQSFDIRYKHLLTDRLPGAPPPDPVKEAAYDDFYRDDDSEEEEDGDDDDEEMGDGSDGEGMDAEISKEYQLQSGYLDDGPASRYEPRRSAPGQPAHGQPPFPPPGYGQQPKARGKHQMYPPQPMYGYDQYGYPYPMHGYDPYGHMYPPTPYHQGGHRGSRSKYLSSRCHKQYRS